MTGMQKFFNSAKSGFLSSFAELSSLFGWHKLSARFYRTVVESRLSTLGPDNIQTARAQFDLADQLLDGSTAELAEAAGLLERAQFVFNTQFGQWNISTGRVLHRLGFICERNEEMTQAEALYRQCHQVFVVTAPSWYLEHADALEHLAAIIAARGGDDSEVRRYQRRARIIRARYSLMRLRGRYSFYLYR